MFYFRFGSGCFHHPNNEETIDMIVASKTEYRSLAAFGEACIKKVWEYEYENNFTSQSLSERLNLSINRTASSGEAAELIALLRSIEWVEFVDFDEKKIKEIIILFEPEWNMKTYAYEIDYGYVYLEWGTSA